MDKKFLGICIVVASLILSGTLLYTSFFADTKDRFKVAGARVFDTQEGKFVEDATENVSEATDIEKVTSQDLITQNDNGPIIDNSIVKYDVQLPDPINSTSTFKSRLAAHDIKITVMNISEKYAINYLEAEIKLYKGDVVFLKDTIIVEDREGLNGYKEAININPLSSYDTRYSMDSKITYPDRPWKSEVTTKIVKGVSME